MHRQPRLLFGTSAAITKVLDQCARFARSRDPVVLLGERGTGKTVLAQYIHELSGRPGEFVKVSASHIPEHLELAHLGGHSRGSYTGADRDQLGLLEAAHTGTFFLDELGHASAKVQEILLQVIEEGTIRRVRETRSRPLDVRFVLATNADLNHLVEEGCFRKDLLDRLGFCRIRVPSLADRPDEIPQLLRFYLEREAAEDRMEKVPELSPELLGCLQSAPWPGNIRELENLCKYLVKFADLARPLELADLPYDFVGPLGDILRHLHESASDKARVREALRRTGGNKSAAARLLGMSRTHFYRLLGNKPAA
jgi:DNA-binding NtrC family response regulator